MKDAPRLTRPLLLFIVGGTMLLALPRFAHTTPDSIYYTDLITYFRGDLERSALQTPFAFRWVAPRVAAALPGLSAEVSMALLGITATVLAYLSAMGSFTGLLATHRQLVVAAAALVISFPTLNYSSAVLTDAAGFLVLALACGAMLKGRFLWLALILAAGTGIRESTLLMLPALWLFLSMQPSRHGVMIAITITATTLLAALAGRWYFSDLPAYFWVPSWSRFMENMTRPVSWATVSLTLAPLLLLLAASGRTSPPLPRRLRAFSVSILIPGTLLVVYSITSAYMSGRFCWPLYLGIVPVLAWRFGGERRATPNCRDTPRDHS